MKTKASMTLIAGCFLLSACKPEVVADVYIGDIYEAIETSEVISTPITIRVPIQSVDDCEESQQTILPILNSHSDNGVSFVQCERLPLELFDIMIVETDVDLIFVAPGASVTFDGLGAVLIGGFANLDVYEAYFVLTQKYQSMINALDSAFPFQRVDGNNVDFSITINNDTRGAVQLYAGGSFIDGQPVMRSRPFSLERRDELRVESSDLSSAYLAQNGFIHFGFVAGQGSELPESWQSIRGLFSETPWSPN